MNALLDGMNHAAASGLAALLNTLWYAGAVVGLTWIILRCLPRVNAATRYWIWIGVLISLFALPFVPGLVKQAHAVLADHAQAISASHPLARVPAPSENIQPLAPVTLSANTAPGSKPWPLWLLAAWIIAAAWQLARLVRGVALVRRLKLCAEVACALGGADMPDFGMSARSERGSAKFRFPETPRPFHRKEKSRGVKEQLRATSLAHIVKSAMVAPPGVTRRPVQVLTSAGLDSPVAVGYRRPAVIVPPGLLERLEESERRNVLLHELAHLARYDDWMALVTHALGAVLVFHPLSAIVLRQIEREREMACDDFVVARTGSARSYARSLARLHDLRWSAGTRLLAPGLLGRHSSLGNRIESLLRGGRKFSARPSLASLGVSALLLAVLLGAGGLIPGWIAIAQTNTATAAPKFEVVSIKPSKPGARGGSLLIPHGRFTTTNEPLKMIIGWAYNYKRPGFSLDVLGGPSWINSERFDIVAKVPDSLVDQEENKLSFDQWADQIRLMVQSMFAQRFKLKVSYETKELPIYALVVAKHGSKLTEAAKLPPGRGPLMRMGMRGQLTGMRVPIALLTYALSHQPELGGRKVVDQTGLKGDYDFTLKWTPEFQPGGMMGAGPEPGGAARAGAEPGGSGQSAGPGPVIDSSSPSLFTALQEQLGLRLKPAKGPVEVLVINHIEPPTPN